ncbi:MAG TPA: radical SAM protein [Thermodesulfobacteriota bacterium]|nr:radical SAM protein [Thermodesulfobacteriota bacterium]
MAGSRHRAAYLDTFERGLFPGRIAEAFALLEKCTVCPRKCGVDRTKGERGFCRAGGLPEISSFGPHFGEERPLVGRNGSGTIFMTHCNLGCVFCQNYSISRLGEGYEISFEEFSRVMVELQRKGCHNINFVSPSHFVPHILKALPRAVEMGLTVPLVYNTGGYDSVEALKLLDGIFDIYMPDFKYVREDVAEVYSQAPDYPQAVMAALEEMHRQTGDLTLDDRGIAVRGLLVRHLVLPEDLAGTREAMRFLATRISPNTYVNIMAQYYPCGDRIPPGSPLARRITRQEFTDAIRMAREEGITRIDRE